MDANLLKIQCLTLLFIAFLASGSAIRCYQCWTKEEEDCEQLGPRAGEPDDCEPKDNVCKKVVTNFYKMEKRGQTSVYALLSKVTSRLCGRSDERGCKDIKGASSLTTECICDEDGCNHSQRPLAVIPVTILMASVAWLATCLH